MNKAIKELMNESKHWDRETVLRYIEVYRDEAIRYLDSYHHEEGYGFDYTQNEIERIFIIDFSEYVLSGKADSSIDTDWTKEEKEYYESLWRKSSRRDIVKKMKVLIQDDMYELSGYDGDYSDEKETFIYPMAALQWMIDTLDEKA